MSSRPPRQQDAVAWGFTLRSQVADELDRARRMRWIAAAATLAVGVVLVWALLGRPPFGADPLVVIAVVLGLVTVLYGIEVVLAGRRAGRLARLASSEDQQRRTLAADLEQMEAIDVAARRLAGAGTLSEAIESILSGARGLVPAVSGAVLLDAAEDLRVSMMGADVTDDAAAVSVAGQELAARALARGGALRGGHETALEEEGAPSRLAVPLRAGAEVVGVLVLERATDNAAFSAGEQRVLERLAPHAALALVRAGRLADRSAAHLAPASPTPPGSADVVPATVDLSVVVREVVAALGAGEQGGRRIAVLAASPALTRADGALLRRALANLLRGVDLSIPPDGAVAIEVLPVGPDWDVAIAHAGEVLPPQVLQEPPPGAPDEPSVQELVEELGGVVTVRERSGMAQIRFRVPGVADLEIGPSTSPLESSAVS